MEHSSFGSLLNKCLPFQFPYSVFFALFYKAVKQDNALADGNKIENPRNITCRLNAQFPQLACDVFYERLGESGAILFKHVNVAEGFGAMLYRQLI